jgi:hypothetical protein
MIEAEFIGIFVQGGVGAAALYLMYSMSDKTIRTNTEAVNNMRITMQSVADSLHNVKCIKRKELK